MKTFDSKFNIFLSFLMMFVLAACGGAASENTATSGVSENSAADQIIATPTSHSVPLKEMDCEAVRPLQGTGIGGTLSPADLRTHYNLPATTKLNGTNQTIAIVDAPGSSTIATDLNAFSSYYKLPVCNTSNPCFEEINQSNGATNSGWAVEISLDVEWAHAIAPNAKILLVIAKSSSFSDMMTAVNTAASEPGVVAVTMSWGTAEFITETATAYDAIFQKYQAKGITFIASSGDAGDNGTNQSWPAASPYVTTVGGTSIKSLLASSAPTPATEVVWIDSGGGASMYETMPNYQKAYLAGTTVLSESNGKRVYPDVAYDADPNASPVGVYSNGDWYAVGGTSAGCPQWGAIMALVANYRVVAGKTTLQSLVENTAGGFNGVIYQVKLESTSFFEITEGSDDTSSRPCALCTASDGYDASTGLGVPNVTKLLSFF